MQLIDKEIKIIISQLKRLAIDKKGDYNRTSLKNSFTFENFCNFAFSKINIDSEIKLSSYKAPDVRNCYEHFNSAWSFFFRSLKEKYMDLIYEYIKICPYCGKVPLIYFDKNKKKSRSFDFEHFFPKSIYNWLAINFYNLLPVCTFCNQKIKKDRDFYEEMKQSWWSIFHPYFGWLSVDWDVIKIENTNFHTKFKFNKTEDLKSFHSKTFSLNEIYFTTQDTKNDIAFIRESVEKLKVWQTNLPWKDIDNIKKDFFKHYVPKDETEILKFANGKLKKDWIDNLDI